MTIRTYLATQRSLRRALEKAKQLQAANRSAFGSGSMPAVAPVAPPAEDRITVPPVSVIQTRSDAPPAHEPSLIEAQSEVEETAPFTRRDGLFHENET